MRTRWTLPRPLLRRSVAAPCYSDLVCTTGDHCTSTSEVDANGNLSIDGGTGSSDASYPGDGSAGNGGSGGNAGSGGSGGNAGGGGSGGGSADARPESDAASNDASSAGDSADAGSVLAEYEPNDTRETPMPLPLAATVRAQFAAAGEYDFYEVSVPDTDTDTAGGYFVFSVTDIPQGELNLDVLSGVNYPSVLSTYTAQIGVSKFGYFATGPKKEAADGGPNTGRFLIRMQAKAGQVYPYRYTLDVKYIRAEDAREPDDTRQTARPLALNGTARALLFAGFAGSSIPSADYYDWYALELGAGAYSALLTAVPESVDGHVALYNSAGTRVTFKVNATRGADVALSGSVATAGTYYFLVTAYHLPSAQGTTALPGEVPAHFTQPYSFTVTQP